MIMIIKKKMKSLMAAMMLFVLAAAMLLQTVPVKADDGGATSAGQTGSVTLTYPAANVKFSLYYIGVSDQQGGYTLSEPYSQYGVDLTATNAADTLAGYVTSDGIAATKESTTADGKVSFTDLPQGVYLLLGETAIVDNVKYTPQSVMLEMPQWNDNKELVYDVTVEGKYSKEDTAKTDLTVSKVWSNDTESGRPTSIKIQLLKNGAVYEECELSKSSNWTKEWKDLDGTATWTVKEVSVPSGYTVSQTKNENKIVITNKGTNTSKSSGSSSKSSSSSSKLPQTGQLWWPASVLAAFGLFFVLVGLICVRSRRS